MRDSLKLFTVFCLNTGTPTKNPLQTSNHNKTSGFVKLEI